jgi:hypothetical protein
MIAEHVSTEPGNDVTTQELSSGWPSESGHGVAMKSFAKDGFNVLHWDRDGFEFWAFTDVNAVDPKTFAGL